MQAIRDEKSPIAFTSFADLITSINKNEYERDGTTMQRLQPSGWDFDEKTRLLYWYQLPKLNKNIHDALMDIED